MLACLWTIFLPPWLYMNKWPPTKYGENWNFDQIFDFSPSINAYKTKWLKRWSNVTLTSIQWKLVALWLDDNLDNLLLLFLAFFLRAYPNADEDFRSAGWTIKARSGHQLASTSPRATTKLNPLKGSWEFHSPERSTSAGADWRLKPIGNPVFSPETGETAETPTLGRNKYTTSKNMEKEEDDGPRASFFDSPKHTASGSSNFFLHLRIVTCHLTSHSLPSTLCSEPKKTLGKLPFKTLCMKLTRYVTFAPFPHRCFVFGAGVKNWYTVVWNCSKD